MGGVSVHRLALVALLLSCLLPLAVLRHIICLANKESPWIKYCTSSIRWLSPHYSASGKQQSKCSSHHISPVITVIIMSILYVYICIVVEKFPMSVINKLDVSPNTLSVSCIILTYIHLMAFYIGFI